MFTIVVCINLYSVISSLLLEERMHHTSPFANTESTPSQIHYRSGSETTASAPSVFWVVFVFFFLKIGPAWCHVMKCRCCSSTFVPQRMNLGD